MVALNFQPQFAADVEAGIKCQTIRRAARCKAGDRIQLYMGQRTKACRKLGEATCKRVRPVRICDTEIWLDGVRLYAGNAGRDDLTDCDNDFAQKDGFPGFVEMAEWFRERYGALPFDGYVIEWIND
jgi:hypothetical protein